MDAELEKKCADLGLPDGDVEELRKFAEFLKARKEYRRARDEGRVTPEMRQAYVDMINGLSDEKDADGVDG